MDFTVTTAAGSTDSAQTREKRNTLLAVSLGIACIPLCVSLSGVVLDPIRQQFHASYSDLQWFLNAFLLLYASLPVAFGHLADRRGRRRIFVIGVLGFVVAPILCGLAPNIQALIAGRLLLGIAAALVGGSSLALISHAFPVPTERKLAFGIMGAALGLALALGAAAGGFIIDLAGWRAAFFGQGMFAILPLLFLGGTRESFDRAAPHIDYPGALLATAAFVSWMAFGIVGPSHGWTVPLSLALLIGSLGASAAFVVVELRGRSPMIEFAMFKNRNFSGATAAVSLVTAVSVAGFYFIPLYYQSSGSMSATQAGSLMLYMFVPAIFMPLLIGWISRWIGSGILLGSGFAVMAVGFLLLYHGTALGGSIAIVLGGLVLLGIGSGMIAGLVEATAMSALPLEKAATGTGIFDSLRIVGNSVGTITGGAVLASVFAESLTRSLAAVGVSSKGADFDQLVTSTLAGRYDEPAIAALTARGIDFQEIAARAHSVSMATLMLIFAIIAGGMTLVCVFAIRARYEVSTEKRGEFGLTVSS